MPPKSDPRREEAKKLYLESRGKKSLQCIADELGLSKSTVASWKVRDDWAALLKGKGRKNRSQTAFANGDANQARKKSGYYGNTNAAGQRADVSNFMGNKNALKTGQYETIKYSTMTEEERQLMEAVQDEDDDVSMQYRLIRELEVREMRMYQRIEQLRQRADNDGMVLDGLSVETKHSGQPGTETAKNIKVKARKDRKAALQRIQEIEAALSVVQRQKQTAILALHKLRQDCLSNDMEQKRYELQKQRVELDRRRLALLDPNEESDALTEAKRLLEGIPSAF